MTGYAGPRALRRLLDAVVSVSADLDLSAVLERIIAAATELVDARYGALGVLDETKTRLARFLTVGIDDDTYRAIGDLPKGHGILGLLIVDPKPLRLPALVGRGIGERAAGAGYGLRNMAERAEGLGGRFEIGPGGPGGGTALEWRVPATGGTG